MTTEKENFINRLQRERNEVLDALVASEDWMDAMRKIENTVYKGDARKDADDKRNRYLGLLAKVRPLIESRRTNGS